MVFGRDTGLYEVAADGTGLRKLYDRGVPARWSRDGGALVLLDHTDGENDIVVLDPKKGEADRLFDGEYGDSVHAVDWMPDNRSLVFLRRVGVLDASWELWLLDTRTGESRRLRSVAAVSHPSVAADGRILYACKVQEQSTLCVTDERGRDLGVLPYAGYFPSYDWSPDGRWVVATAAAGSGTDIVLLAIEGAAERRVLFSRHGLGGGNGLGGPTWFPDGSHIAFGLVPSPSVVPDSGGGGACNAEPCPHHTGIWSVRINGSDARPITDGASDWAPDLAPVN